MSGRFLTALPVYNEAAYVGGVLAEVRRYSDDIVVVDDGSTDGTAEALARERDIHIVRHPNNRGYGAALQTAFCYAQRHNYEIVVTIDCDGQHEPCRIPKFVAACDGWDIVSGSRYLETHSGEDRPPADRQQINALLTAELNARLGLSLTDAFCGFKAYRVAALEKLDLHETGYAMPLELWVQAARSGLTIRELAVPLIYLDLTRSFGGALDDAQTRLAHYREVLERALAADFRPGRRRWAGSLCEELAG